MADILRWIVGPCGIRSFLLPHDLPWMVVGDFNAILDVSDRVGGRLPQAADTLDFAACLNAAGLSDLGGLFWI